MSKYVTHKNGLIIGSDNVFCFRDEKDNFHSDFRAIVWAEDPKFLEITSGNYNIRSLSQQFMWDENNNPTYMIRSWLNENCPGWGARTNPSSHDAAIFFKKRGHALAFVKWINENLKLKVRKSCE